MSKHVDTQPLFACHIIALEPLTVYSRCAPTPASLAHDICFGASSNRLLSC